MNVATDLRQVASIYEQAMLSAAPPVQAVASSMGLSHAVAAKRVQAARIQGLLPPTMRGKKASFGTVGAHRPVAANIASSPRRNVYLCEACLVQWPCSEATR